MSSSTTIRVDRAVHNRLLQISNDSDVPLGDVVRSATEALERSRFAAKVRREMDALREDPNTWADYLESFELTVNDGLLHLGLNSDPSARHSAAPDNDGLLHLGLNSDPSARHSAAPDNDGLTNSAPTEQAGPVGIA